MSAQLLLLVAAGGALGAVTRYGLTLLVTRLAGDALPFGTLLVNIVGSFVLGLLVEAALTEGRVSPEMRALVGTGFCGALTTFSAVSVETLSLGPGWGLANAFGNLGLALGFAWAGMWVVRALQGAG